MVKYLKLFLLLIIFLVLAGIGYGENITIDECGFVINYTGSGNNYNLSGNLTCDGNGVVVDANVDDVIIDCKGHSIIGSGNEAGIFFDTYSGSSDIDMKNILVKNCHIKNFSKGIDLQAKAYVSINCDCGGCEYRTGHTRPQNIDFVKNRIEYCDQGIFFRSSESEKDRDCCPVLGVEIISCDTKKIAASIKFSDIIDSTFKYNNYGIYFTNKNDHEHAYITDCNVTGNIFQDNNYGIYFAPVADGAKDNLIYDNFFKDNSEANAFDPKPAGTNTWYYPDVGVDCPEQNFFDNGCLAGNYWDDYTGEDTDGDGTGDTNVPYLAENGQDLHPLICPVLVDGECKIGEGDAGAFSCNRFGDWEDFDDNLTTYEDNCCGDDPEDEGRVVIRLEENSEETEFLCAENTDGDMQWISAKDSNAQGNIFQINGVEQTYHVVSFGAGNEWEWAACDANNDGAGSFEESKDSDILNLGNISVARRSGDPHEYICLLNRTTGVEAFGECMGENAAHSVGHDDLLGNVGDSIYDTGDLIKLKPPIIGFDWKLSCILDEGIFDFIQTELDEIHSSSFSKENQLMLLGNLSYLANKKCLSEYGDIDHLRVDEITSSNIDVFFSDEILNNVPSDMPSNYYPDSGFNPDNVFIYAYNFDQADSEFRFCSADGEWSEDIDDAGDETCEQAGFEWTGSQCCGDDGSESYNDMNWPDYFTFSGVTDVGGCYNGEMVDNNSLLVKEPVVVNGSFDSSRQINSWSGSFRAYIDDTNNRLELEDRENISQNITNRVFPGEYKLNTYMQTHPGTSAEVSVWIDGIKNKSITWNSLDINKSSFYFSLGTYFEEVIILINASGNGEAYIHNVSVEPLTKDVLNYNGSFYGCSLEEEKLSYYVNKSGARLITDEKNESYCQDYGDYFCSVSKGWFDEVEGAGTIGARNTIKSAPFETERQEECCPSDYCWNGSQCVSGGDFFIDNMKYTCSEGNWTDYYERCKWNESDNCGYCPNSSSCYDGDECIESEDYVFDNYCVEGNWTTRTNKLARAILKLIENKSNKQNYGILCGDYDNTLNRYDYNIEEGAVKEYILGKVTNSVLGIRECGDVQGPCVNDFCIAKYESIDNGDKKIVLGTSLNQPINKEQLSFLEALELEKSYCDTLVGGGSSMFENCSGENKVWYNDELNSVIYSKNGVNLGEAGFWESFYDWIFNPFQSFISVTNPNVINIDTMQPIIDSDYHDGIYGVKEGDKQIIGYLYESSNLYWVSYSGFDENICESIEEYAQAKNITGGLVCNATDEGDYEVYNVFAEGLDLWSDLTAKLRIS